MPSNTIPVKWLQDKNGNEFYPVTHKGAIRDDSGNPISVPEELNDLNDVTITPVVDSTQTYFENAVQDYDGNWYDAIILGDQVWMAENLKTSCYADGTPLTYGGSSVASGSIAYYYYPNGSESNIEQYGLLYNLPAVMNGASSSSSNPSGVQGIAPNGWHIPSDAEWTQMMTWVGQQQEYILNNNSNYIAKALASTYGWNTSTESYAIGNNQSANNATGFNASPAGYRNGGSYYFGGIVFFWSTEESNSYAHCCTLNYDLADVRITTNSVSTPGSVRCLYNGTASQFREQMAARSLQNQILKHDGTHWVNTEFDHNFTFDNEIASTSSTTVTFGASQRGTHFISAGSDLSITFNVNNESDNYLWIYNTGNSAIQVYISDMLHNESQVHNIYMPEDDIIIQPGYAGEIGIVCNSVGAFITTRCDLRYTVNSPSV